MDLLYQVQRITDMCSNFTVSIDILYLSIILPDFLPPGFPRPARDLCSTEESDVVLLCCRVQLSLFISGVSLCHVSVPLCHTNTSIMIIRSLISSTLLILANSGRLYFHWWPHHLTSHYRQQGGHERDPTSQPRPGEDAESPQAQGWLQTSPPQQWRISRPHSAPAHTLLLCPQQLRAPTTSKWGACLGRKWSLDNTQIGDCWFQDCLCRLLLAPAMGHLQQIPSLTTELLSMMMGRLIFTTRKVNTSFSIIVNVLHSGVLCGCVNLPASYLGRERRTGWVFRFFSTFQHWNWILGLQDSVGEAVWGQIGKCLHWCHGDYLWSKWW